MRGQGATAARVFTTSCGLQHVLQTGKVPSASWATMVGNNAPFQLTSFALGLLLVFRCAGYRGACSQKLCA